ncbi:MAG: metallophosphoesterase [Candidatus Heimdallarchaeota archaeon]|nr:metallophosphoesterase [Candidatus Heimdallarchaeota archaeon]
MFSIKLLVLSDVHGAKWKLDDLIFQTNPDVIVIPGDLPSSIDFPVLVMTYGRGGNRTNYVRNIYRRFIERLTYKQIRTSKRLLTQIASYNIPVMLIHGNTETQETRDWLSLFSHRYPNIFWISDTSAIIDNTQFIGHGWVAVPNEYNRELTPGEISEDIARLILLDTIGRSDHHADRTILISHAPPLNTSIDYLPHKRIHVGSKPVREMLDSKLADIVISGHLHEARGIHHSKKGWWGINAGAVVEDVACTIDLEDNSVVWYKNVINKIGIPYLLYSRRVKYGYDQQK